MTEIRNCQRLSMGPNFVVFLGQKYGYRPIPTYILASELAQFRECLVGLGIDVILLDTWYKKDANAVPPICILQPISSILVNFNNKVIDGGRFRSLLECSLKSRFRLDGYSEFPSCSKRIRPNGGTRWTACRSCYAKQRNPSTTRINSVTKRCTITSCPVGP